MVGEKVFMIGSVKEGDGSATLVRNPRYIEDLYQRRVVSEGS